MTDIGTIGVDVYTSIRVWENGCLIGVVVHDGACQNVVVMPVKHARDLVQRRLAAIPAGESPASRGVQSML